jgi:hypothetical protein
MRLNTRTLKIYLSDAKFKNVRGTYAYVGDRLLWTQIPGIVTKKEILEIRKMTEDFSKKNVRWEGELVVG